MATSGGIKRARKAGMVEVPLKMVNMTQTVRIDRCVYIRGENEILGIFWSLVVTAWNYRRLFRLMRI